MEKYFIITKESRFHTDWYKYTCNYIDVNNFMRDFLKENNIESSKYILDNNSFGIVPTESDTLEFNSQMKKVNEYGVRFFKKSSKIYKKLFNELKEMDLQIINRPELFMYIRSAVGRTKNRLFENDGILYGSFEWLSSDSDFELPEGFEEIKASEFYKVMEK